MNGVHAWIWGASRTVVHVFRNRRNSLLVAFIFGDTPCYINCAAHFSRGGRIEPVADELQPMSLSCACPRSEDPASLHRALRCFHPAPNVACSLDAAVASSTAVVAFHCLANGSAPGLFVVARDAAGRDRCVSVSDDFQLRVTERSLTLGTFTVLSTPVATRDGFSAYWFNIGYSRLRLAGGGARGAQTFSLELALVETSLGLSALTARRCVWERVPLPSDRFVRIAQTSPPPSTHTSRELRACRGREWEGGDAATYVRVAPGGACGHACIGANASQRLLDTANRARALARIRQGFAHALRPHPECALRLYDEEEVSRCLGGRSLLLMGSTPNVDLRKGFARLNATLGAWTRVPPGKLHPNVADFWRGEWQATRAEPRMLSRA
jgi:hypothetical protein